MVGCPDLTLSDYGRFARGGSIILAKVAQALKQCGQNDRDRTFLILQSEGTERVTQ
jgi:hypothetical protein